MIEGKFATKYFEVSISIKTPGTNVFILLLTHLSYTIILYH